MDKKNSHPHIAGMHLNRKSDAKKRILKQIMSHVRKYRKHKIDYQVSSSGSESKKSLNPDLEGHLLTWFLTKTK